MNPRGSNQKIIIIININKQNEQMKETLKDPLKRAYLKEFRSLKEDSSR